MVVHAFVIPFRSVDHAASGKELRRQVEPPIDSSRFHHDRTDTHYSARRADRKTTSANPGFSVKTTGILEKPILAVPKAYFLYMAKSSNGSPMKVQ